MSNAKVDCAALSPGLWRIEVPFPSPLGSSNAYLIRTDEGVVVVDPGWDHDEGWDCFLSGLARAGATVQDVRGVVVTHAHPDHYGLTRRLQDLSEAWIGLHPAERPQLVPALGDREERVARIADWLARCGVPAESVEDLMADRARLLAELSPNLPTLDVVDQMVIPHTSGTLVAIHTPGHTPGHLVFHDRDRNVLFTGDHLLPRISANISVRPTSGRDPLGDYERSLGALAAHEKALGAPGHEWAFDSLPERIDAVRRHHAARLSEVHEAVKNGAATAWEVAQTVRWSRPFDTLNPRGQRSAIGEAASHLVRLARSGALVQRATMPTTYTTAPSPATPRHPRHPSPPATT